MASTHCDSQFTLKEKCIFVYAIVRITDKFMLLLVSSYIMFLIDVCYYISSLGKINDLVFQVFKRKLICALELMILPPKKYQIWVIA